MRISARSFFAQALVTFQRFPLTLIAAAVCTFIQMRWFDNVWNPEPRGSLEKLREVSFLAMLLSLSVTLFCERLANANRKKIIGWTLVVLLAVFYYFIADQQPAAVTAYRFSLLSVSFHLLVAFAPFTTKGTLNGLWQFNRIIFLRILLAFLYSAVLFIGLSLALLAIDQLLDIDVPSRAYPHLLAFIAGIFNTWFFLAGIPSDFEPLDEDHTYPKGLRIFTANVLLPLVTIYMVILYLYAGKAVLGAYWRTNMLSYMVLAFAFFGILSLLLLYPLKDDERYRWVRISSRSFYFLLLPLVLLMMFAVFSRVRHYGVTEGRYMLIVLALWLVGISAYSILRNLRNVKVIPVSLCIVIFLSSFGPWGAFSVSKRSQLSRLENILERNGLLVDGKFPDRVKQHALPQEDAGEVRSIVYYISQTHGFTSLQPLFAFDISEFDNRSDADLDDNSLLELMVSGTIRGMAVGEPLPETPADTSSAEGTAPAPAADDHGMRPQEQGVPAFFSIDPDVLIPTKGYDYAADFTMGLYADHERNYHFGKDSIRLSFDYGTNMFEVRHNRHGKFTVDARPKFRELFEARTEEKSHYTMVFGDGDSRWKFRIVLTQLHLIKDKDVTAGDMYGKIYVSVKR